MDFSFIKDDTERAQAESEYAASIVTLKAGVDTQIAEAVTALKDKNEDIITEKRKLQEKLEGFEGLDAEAVAEAIATAKKAKEDAMTADERSAKAISDLKSDHTSILEELNIKLESAMSAQGEYKAKFEGKVINDELRAAAISAGVLPAAVEDVVMQGRSVFSLGDDHKAEARTADNALLKNDDGIIMTTKIWAEGLKKSKPYYFPTSQSAGMSGKLSTDRSETLDKMEALLAKGDMKGYKEMQAKAAVNK